MTPGQDGQLSLDMDDQIVRAITVCRDGELLWPPPAVTVSAAPTGQAGPSAEEAALAQAQPMVSPAAPIAPHQPLPGR